MDTQQEPIMQPSTEPQVAAQPPAAQQPAVQQPVSAVPVSGANLQPQQPHNPVHSGVERLFGILLILAALMGFLISFMYPAELAQANLPASEMRNLILSRSGGYALAPLFLIIAGCAGGALAMRARRHFFFKDLSFAGIADVLVGLALVSFSVLTTISTCILMNGGSGTTAGLVNSAGVIVVWVLLFIGFILMLQSVRKTAGSKGAISRAFDMVGALLLLGVVVFYVIWYFPVIFVWEQMIIKFNVSLVSEIAMLLPGMLLSSIGMLIYFITRGVYWILAASKFQNVELQ